MILMESSTCWEIPGFWLIAIIMTGYGMDVAMIVGGSILAVSTYAVQTIAYLHPINGHITAVMSRSSRKNRALDQIIF